MMMEAMAFDEPMMMDEAAAPEMAMVIREPEASPDPD